MINLGDKKYSIRFTEEELQKYQSFANERNRTLATVIRDALDAVCENPALLKPSHPKTDLDTIINALEISARERLTNDMNFRQDVYDNLARVNHKINFLLESMKIPSKTIKRLDNQDISGEAIFD